MSVKENVRKRVPSISLGISHIGSLSLLSSTNLFLSVNKIDVWHGSYWTKMKQKNKIFKELVEFALPFSSSSIIFITQTKPRMKKKKKKSKFITRQQNQLIAILKLTAASIKQWNLSKINKLQ